MEFNRKKFKTIVHYICHAAEKDALGATKLNKILWYADSISYLETGIPLTGETYIKKDFGPIPRHILNILDELDSCDHVKRERSDYYQYKKTTYNCKQQPDLSCMREEETDLINVLIDFICKEHTAKSISESTHDRIWEIAEQGEEIPLFATLVSKIEEPTGDAIKWGLSAIKTS